MSSKTARRIAALKGWKTRRANARTGKKKGATKLQKKLARLTNDERRLVEKQIQTLVSSRNLTPRKKTKKKRSEAAKKGWEKKKQSAKQKAAIARFNKKTSSVSVSSTATELYKNLGNIGDIAIDLRDWILGPDMDLHGSEKIECQILQRMITDKDDFWVKFEEAAAKLGLDPQQARTIWFSPKARTRF